MSKIIFKYDNKLQIYHWDQRPDNSINNLALFLDEAVRTEKEHLTWIHFVCKQDFQQKVIENFREVISHNNRVVIQCLSEYLADPKYNYPYQISKFLLIAIMNEWMALIKARVPEIILQDRGNGVIAINGKIIEPVPKDRCTPPRILESRTAIFSQDTGNKYVLSLKHELTPELKILVQFLLKDAQNNFAQLEPLLERKDWETYTTVTSFLERKQGKICISNRTIHSQISSKQLIFCIPQYTLLRLLRHWNQLIQAKSHEIILTQDKKGAVHLNTVRE